MKNLFYKTKKSIYQITKNDDGTVTFYPKEMNAGCIIQNRGGVTEFLKFCLEDDRSYEEFVRDEELIRKKKQEYDEAIRIKKLNAEKEMIMKAYDELLARYGMDINHIDKSVVVEITIENLYIIMRYMKINNWGTWKLPKLSQGYSFGQHDCNGKTAVTITLDNGITTEEGKLVKKLQYGAPNGYLTNYTNIGRL